MMVAIRLTVARCGDFHSARPGDVIDVPADEAGRMIAAGQAEAEDDGPEANHPATRKATRPPKEKR